MKKKYFKIIFDNGGWSVGVSSYNPLTSDGNAFKNGVVISKSKYYQLRKELKAKSY